MNFIGRTDDKVTFSCQEFSGCSVTVYRLAVVDHTAGQHIGVLSGVFVIVITTYRTCGIGDQAGVIDAGFVKDISDCATFVGEGA